MTVRTSTKALAAAGALELVTLQAVPAQAATVHTGFQQCGSSSDIIIMSSDSRGYTDHWAYEYGSTDYEHSDYGWVDGMAGQLRRSMWTDFDTVDGLTFYGSVALYRTNYYCA